MRSTMKYVEKFSYKLYNIMKSLISLVKLHKFKLVNTINFIRYMNKIYWWKAVRSGAVYENDSTLALVRVACMRGERMEWYEGRWIAQSKQAVKLPFKY